MDNPVVIRDLSPQDIADVSRLMGAAFAAIPDESETFITSQMGVEAFKRAAQHIASLDLDRRVRMAMSLRTPPNVLEKRIVAGSEDKGNAMYATYVRIGYMERVMCETLSPDYKFRTLKPPTLIIIPGKARVEPTYECYLELDVYIAGFLVRTIGASGTTPVRDKEGGIETAAKGCVTDAMKKAFSYLGICADVYQYGDTAALDSETVAIYIKGLIEEFGLTSEEIKKVSIFLSAANKLNDLRDRYWTVYDKFKLNQQRQKQIKAEKERQNADTEGTADQNA